jgi:hypothetical protein
MKRREIKGRRSSVIVWIMGMVRGWLGIRKNRPRRIGLGSS